MTIVPEVADQENRSRAPAGLFYWEGAVQVRAKDGASLGLGYVELTGYGGKKPS
jgi:predicted secreted hydrolase